MIDWAKIIQAINEALDIDEKYQGCSAVSGGDINSAYRLSTKNNQHYFVKLNQSNLINMFIAEFEALNDLQQCTFINSPHPICYGQLAQNSFIVMEYITLSGQGNDYNLGQNLAKMHQITKKQFGWKLDNTIGSTAQTNCLDDNWTEFWKTQRLLPQFELLYSKGYASQLKTKANYLIAELDNFFDGHCPMPSLLHGDLWSGNYAFDNNGGGVIFDPALYYGDRETDLAMTELFGGFSKEFYQGYQEEFKLADSYKKRKPMYNLYHLLNHANLFGGSYVQQSLNTIELILNKL